MQQTVDPGREPINDRSGREGSMTTSGWFGDGRLLGAVAQEAGFLQ